MQRSAHSRRGANRKSPKWLLAISALAVLLVAFGSLSLGSTIFPNAKISQLAAVIETTSKNCEEAKQAAARGVSSGSQSGMGSEIDDKCTAAIFDQSKVQPNEQNPRQNPKNYKCVGKTVKVSTDAKGKITESWNAATGVPQGTCSTQYCDASGCKPAKQMSDINGAAEMGQQSGQPLQTPEIPKAGQVEQLPQQQQPTRNWPECEAFGTCVEQALNNEPAPPPTENKSWTDRMWEAIQKIAGVEPAGAPTALELTEVRPEDIQRWQGLENPTALAPDYAPKGSDSIPTPPPAYDNFGSNSTFGSPTNDLSAAGIEQRLQDPGNSARERGYTSLIDAPYLIRDSFQYLWSRLRSLF